MIIRCKEMVHSSNEDGTRRIELFDCRFKSGSGRTIEGTIILPEVFPSDAKWIQVLPREEENPETITVVI